MLSDFIASLSDQYPEARLDMKLPAVNDADALARFEVLCSHYSEIAHCQDDLASETAYMEYVGDFSEIFGIDPEKAKDTFNMLLAGGFVVGSVLDLLLTEGASHAVHAADVAEIAAHGIDAGEAIATLGASAILSVGAGWFFKKRNGKKRHEVESIAQTAYLKGRLAKALMTPGRMNVAQDALRLLAGNEEG